MHLPIIFALNNDFHQYLTRSSSHLHLPRVNTSYMEVDALEVIGLVDALCKLGADQEPPYPYSLCANPLFWPLMSLISIHAQFILLTQGNTGY